VTEHEDALGYLRLRAHQGRALMASSSVSCLPTVEIPQSAHRGALYCLVRFSYRQNHHAADGQAFGQVLEHFGSADGFVPVVGSGAVDKHDPGTVPAPPARSRVPGSFHWPSPTVTSRSRKESRLAIAGRCNAVSPGSWNISRYSPSRFLMNRK